MESGHPLDPFIATADRALRAVFAPAHASRPVPTAPVSVVAKGVTRDSTAPVSGLARGVTQDSTAPVSGLAEGVTQDSPVGVTGTLEPPPAAERRKSAALMRVNHSGEVAAQALYHGQAFSSRSTATRDLLLRAAHEEADHLAWCETRLKELDSHPSLLNPLWYLGSFAIGALAAAAGDKVSLGFMVETERQVEGHLDEHLARLPAGDARSRAIINVMRTDEIGHGAAAQAAGAAELPAPVRALMRHAARVMTTAAYWI